MSPRPTFSTIDEYLDASADEARPLLQKVRDLVEKNVPDAEETISYGMPAFRKGRIFIYFAAFKKHIGIYPPVKGDDALIAELAPYRGEKGNLKFSLDERLPVKLVTRVIRALVKAYEKPEKTPRKKTTAGRKS